jgi:hypothetical protein
MAYKRNPRVAERVVHTLDNEAHRDDLARGAG